MRSIAQVYKPILPNWCKAAPVLEALLPMKTKHILFVCLIISIGVNLFQYFNEQQLRVNERYFESRYEIKDQDVRTLLNITAAHVSGLSLVDLRVHLDAHGIKYRTECYSQTPEFIYVLVGELTFRFTNKGVFVGVVQSKL